MADNAILQTELPEALPPVPTTDLAILQTIVQELRVEDRATKQAASLELEGHSAELAPTLAKMENRALLVKLLKALNLSVIHDEDADTRLAAWNAMQKMVSEVWAHLHKKQDTQGQFILDQMLRALRDTPSTQIKLDIIDWLEDKIDDFTAGEDSHRAYRRVAEHLNEIKSMASETLKDAALPGERKTVYEDLYERADLTLDKLWQSRADERFDEQKDNLLKSENENKKTTAISMLADRNAMGSRKALGWLVTQWVRLIWEEKDQRLVELMAEYIRYNRYAVLALIEHFGDEKPLPGQKTRDSANQSNPDHLVEHLDEWIDNNRSEDHQLEESELEEAEAFLASDEASNFARANELKHLIYESRRTVDQRKRTLVDRRIAKQLADMSNPAYFEDLSTSRGRERKFIISELRKHAVPVMLRRLAIEEDDAVIREHVVRMLGFTGGREVVDTLASQLVGKEKRRKARQELLNEYYLEPSKKRSQEAAEILNDTVAESKRTLRILQLLNIGVFLVGLTMLTVGLYVSMNSQADASRVIGAVSALGGFVGMIALLIKDPLDRIQNAMARLVHVETAFTSFIWELNLNGTYIQSLYIKNGKLRDEEITYTAQNIENSMEVTMQQVSVHTEVDEPRLVTRLHRIEPAAGSETETITVFGQQLLGDSSQKQERGGMVAIDHTPAQVDNMVWKGDRVTFKLPGSASLGGLQSGKAQVMISLFVDGMETNALPYHIVK